MRFLLKKIIIIPIILIIGFGIVILSDQKEDNDKAIFHITLADSKIYENGTYSQKIVLKQGEYLFRFVPNGDSPKILSISLTGEDFNFYEDFRLNGTSHETGISQYYTWDYDGRKNIEIPIDQEILVQINPNGNVLGSVSVDIIEE